VTDLDLRRLNLQGRLAPGRVSFTGDSQVRDHPQRPARSDAALFAGTFRKLTFCFKKTPKREITSFADAAHHRRVLVSQGVISSMSAVRAEGNIERRMSGA